MANFLNDVMAIVKGPKMMSEKGIGMKKLSQNPVAEMILYLAVANRIWVGALMIYKSRL